jgi:Spy/CpxP family protein refolding chaperone
MKIVRIAGLAIALCVASASIAAAQGRPDSAPPGGRRGGMMGGRLLDGITLTDAQQTQLKVIREKYMPKMQAFRDSLMSTGAPPDSASRAKMMTMNAAYSAEVRAILTADQQAIYDKNVADQAARMRRPPPPPPSN